MNFLYYWHMKNGNFYMTSDKVLADDVLHKGIHVFLIPLEEEKKENER